MDILWKLHGLLYNQFFSQLPSPVTISRGTYLALRNISSQSGNGGPPSAVTDSEQQGIATLHGLQ
jgi:hypothetical protein